MYGHTPNVWRPSEVPYPGQGEDLIDISWGTETVVENTICSGWHLFLDDDVKASLHSPVIRKVKDIPVPSKCPYYLLIAHATYTSGVSSGNLSLQLTDANGVGEMVPSGSGTFVPPNTVRKFVFMSRFLLWGPIGFKQLWIALIAEGGTGATYTTPGQWFSSFPGISCGPYEWNPSSDPWDGHIVPLELHGSVSNKSHTLAVHRIRCYGAAVTADAPYGRVSS